jgi:hypothetical protein
MIVPEQVIEVRELQIAIGLVGAGRALPSCPTACRG